jgi:FAD/FMN-containing dehydrogenase
MMKNLTTGQLARLCELVGPAAVVTADAAVHQLSHDYYWYSPILKAQLEACQADAAVRIADEAMLRAVIAFCVRETVPLTVRGSGTGNYGQIVPLHGGLLLDLAALNAFEILAGGTVRSQPGAKLLDIEVAANRAGWELRTFPSTWTTASIGGFVAGGSAGIGSITYGGLNYRDNVKALKLLTIEAGPREIVLGGTDCLRAMHTYGTTGIITELELRLGAARTWRQLAFAHEDFDRLVDWTDDLAHDDAIPKRLVSLFEAPIPQMFTPMRKTLPAGQHAVFLLIDADAAPEVIARAAAKNLTPAYDRAWPSPPVPPFLTNYTWNHTTLWAIKADPAMTYLQVGYTENFRDQIKALRARFPGEILQHLEWIRVRPKAVNTDGPVGCGGIPLVRFTTAARLHEIIAACTELGVFVANPHTCVLEDSGRHPNLPDKLALKAQADPGGLLNPGKMRSYPVNPFAAAPAA